MTRGLDRIGRAGFLGLTLLVAVSVVYLVLGLVSSLSWDGPGWARDGEQPIGRDFVAFWAAGRLALEGEAAAAYDLARIDAVQTDVAQHDVNTVPFHYPPSFLLVVLPLALLPYPLALLLWLAGPTVAFLALFRRFAGHSAAVPLALVFPATAQCLISGQNGIAFAAVAIAGLLCLDRRPWSAGLILSLLACKPQLAPLLLPALLFGGHWRALAAAAAGAALLMAASWLAFGAEPWRAFLEQMPATGTMLAGGDKPWERMPTVFAAARMLGLGTSAAWLAQGIAAGLAAWAVAWSWRGGAGIRARGAVLAAAIPFATPFLFDYDLVLWLLPLAWLAVEGAARDWSWPDRLVLVVGWLGSVGGWLIAWTTGVPAMTAVGVILLAAVLLRLPRRSAVAAPGPIQAGG